MPYKLKGNCVINSDTNETVKCHKTHGEAVAHLRALYANVPDADVKELSLSNFMAEREVPIPNVNDWGIPTDEGVQVGTLRTLFNGKIHEAMTVVTDQLTQRGYLSEEENMLLTTIKGSVLKLLNKSIPLSLARRQIAPQDLEFIASKELHKELHQLSSQVITIKEANLPYDWAMITSSSYMDREGEYVTQKAHERDIEYMDATGNYGTLDWFHLHPVVFAHLEKKEAVAQLPEFVQKNGIIIGDCTFSAMYGRLRVEAGTYRSKEIKDMMNSHADTLSGSILFFHPQNEPDTQRAYNNIHVVSRAIMPRDKVSNLAAYLSSAGSLA